MKNFRISVMALKDYQRLQIDTINISTEEGKQISSISLGSVGKYKILHPDTELELWIEEIKTDDPFLQPVF